MHQVAPDMLSSIMEQKLHLRQMVEDDMNRKHEQTNDPYEAGEHTSDGDHLEQLEIVIIFLTVLRLRKM